MLFRYKYCLSLNYTFKGSNNHSIFVVYIPILDNNFLQNTLTIHINRKQEAEQEEGEPPTRATTTHIYHQKKKK